MFMLQSFFKKNILVYKTSDITSTLKFSGTYFKSSSQQTMSIVSMPLETCEVETVNFRKGLDLNKHIYFNKRFGMGIVTK